jgi:thioredoxin-related protein
MKRLALLTLFALCANVGSLLAAESAPAFDDKADPAKDVQAAAQKASAEKKRILLDVGGEWCIWCHILDKAIAADPPVTALLAAKYVTVKVNFSEENENKTFLAKYPKIESYPHLIVLDERGKHLTSQDPSVFEKGKGYDVRALETFLKKWAP